MKLWTLVIYIYGGKIEKAVVDCAGLQRVDMSEGKAVECDGPC